MVGSYLEADRQPAALMIDATHVRAAADQQAIVRSPAHDEIHAPLRHGQPAPIVCLSSWRRTGCPDADRDAEACRVYRRYGLRQRCVPQSAQGARHAARDPQQSLAQANAPLRCQDLSQA